MAIEYLGLSSINGPLVVLDGVENAAYDEIVEMNVGGQERKLGKIDVYKRQPFHCDEGQMYILKYSILPPVPIPGNNQKAPCCLS